MRKRKKFIAFASVICMLTALIPAVTYADSVLIEDFDGFTFNQSAVDRDGILTLNGASASAEKNYSFPANYTVNFRMRIEKWDQELGAMFGNSDARCYLQLNPNLLSVAYGGSKYAINAGSDWHTYSFDVTGGNMSIYFDDQYLGDSVLPNPGNAPSNRLRFFSTHTSRFQVSDVSVTVPDAAAEETVYQEPTAAFFDDFSTPERERWQLISDAKSGLAEFVTSEETGTDLHITSVKGSGKGGMALLKSFVPSQSFDVSWRMKVDHTILSTYSGVRINYGVGGFAVWHAGTNYDPEGMIRLGVGNTDLTSYPKIIVRDLKQWHTYRVVADGRDCYFFLDGECVNHFLAEEGGVNTMFRFAAELNADDYHDFTIDWVKYIPIDYNTELLPMDGSQVLEGDNVELSAIYRGRGDSPEYIDYVSGGTVIGRGQAPDYKFVWENVPYGNHEIKAIGTGALSRTSVLRAIPRFGGNLVLPTVSTEQDAVISLEPFAASGHSGAEKVVYRIDGGIYVQTNKDENFTLNLGRLPMDAYRVQADMVNADGFKVSREGTLTVMPDATQGAALGLEYTLDYTISGEGNISGADGSFALDIRHTSDSMTYRSDQGEVTLSLGAGQYNIYVRSGEAEITRNGHFEGSFNLPLSSEAAPLSYGGIEDMKVCVPENNRVLARISGDTDVVLKDVPESWSLEFEKSGVEPETVLFTDGSYRLQMTMDEEIRIPTIPAGTGQNPSSGVEKVKTAPVPEGRHIYRITCVKGLAQLFIDNVFSLSLRLPEVYAPAQLTRTGAAENEFAVVKEIRDIWTFAEDFEETKSISPSEYWDGSAKRSLEIGDSGNCMSIYKGTALINGFMKDPVLHTRMKIDRQGSDGFSVCVRYISDYVYMSVGYNPKTHCWELNKMFQTLTTLASAPGDMPVDEWFDLDVKVSGSLYEVYVNGKQVLSASDDSLWNNGRVGFIAGNRTIRIDDLTLTGNGRVTAGVKILGQQLSWVPQEAVKLKDGTVLLSSYNGGTTTKVEADLTLSRTDITQLGMNTIRLQNGDILTIKTQIADANGENVHSEAWISHDECQTFEGPFIIEKELGVENTYSYSQENNRVEQGRDGRIYYMAHERITGYKGENLSCEWVFYSDDGGRTWSRSKNPNWSAVNGYVGAEGKAVELPDGTVRIYSRSNTGYIRYLDSFDKGETLPQDNVMDSQLTATVVTFNVTPDPDDDNTYYAVFVYDNTNNFRGDMEQPRNRLVLAVSHDGCMTWEFVTDMICCDLNLDGVLKQSHVWNAGLRVFDDYIYVFSTVWGATAAKTAVNQGYVWRVDKSMVRSQKRFPLTHTYTPKYHMDPVTYREKSIDTAYMQAVGNDKALLYGRTVDVEKADAGLVSGKAAAVYLGAALEERPDGSIRLSLGESEAIFVPGSRNTEINGQSYESAAVCTDVNGIPADALGKAFGVQVYADDKYIVLSTDTAWGPILLEKAYARIGEDTTECREVKK